MKRFFKILALGFLLALPWAGASAQQVNNYWLNAATPCPSCWVPTSATNPMPVTGTFTPSGNSVVIGPTADGSPATTPPVLVGGTVDGSATGNIGVAKIDAAGLAYNAITNWGGTALGAMANYGTSPGAVLVPGVNAFITNTVTVTDSTGAATQAPVAPATATATKSALGGCQATSAAINPTTGQQAAVNCDLNNNLLVSSGGAPNFTTSQVTITTSSTAVCAARALRRACTITAITGTQQVYCSGTTATSANGQLIPAVVGANFTANTTAAINCIALVASQTVSVAETF